MNPCITPKKKRAPRRSSVLFSSIESGTEFWFPGCKFPCIKVNVIRADFHGERFFVNPFRSVFVVAPKHAEPESELHRIMREDSERLVGEVSQVLASKSPFIDLVTPGNKYPATEAIRQIDAVCDEANSGRTHFVGDNCAGGHADVPLNNDNNVTGPTS